MKIRIVGLAVNWNTILKFFLKYVYLDFNLYPYLFIYIYFCSFTFGK